MFASMIFRIYDRGINNVYMLDTYMHTCDDTCMHMTLDTCIHVTSHRAPALRADGAAQERHARRDRSLGT